MKDTDHDPRHIACALKEFSDACAPAARGYAAQVLLVIRLPCGCMAHTTNVRPVQDFARAWLEEFESDERHSH